MVLEIPEQTAFASLTFQQVHLAEQLPDRMQLREETHFLRGSPATFERHWREWLGSIQAEILDEGNFSLIATTALPDGRGDAGDKLVLRIRRILYGILLHGIPVFRGQDSGLIIRGYRTQERTEVDRVQTIPTYAPATGVRTTPLDAETLRGAECIASSLARIHEQDECFRRIKRGFVAWERVLREENPFERLHQLVRSIEGAVRPGIGKSRNQFAHRAQHITGRSERARNLLLELYDLRSCSEYLNEWDNVPLQCTEADREDVFWLRTYQAEVLASEIYRRILRSDRLQRHFIKDAEIDAFWAKTDRDLASQWGKPVDLLSMEA